MITMNIDCHIIMIIIIIIININLAIMVSASWIVLLYAVSFFSRSLTYRIILGPGPNNLKSA